MHCDDARRHWSLYHDSEGDAETCFEISEHLHNCPQCAEWFHQQSYFEDQLERKLRSSTLTKPDEELWSRVLLRSEVQQPPSARRWTMLGGILAIAASLLAIVAWGLGEETANLAELTAEHHSRFATLGQPAEYESNSDLEIEDYLRKRVSFPVRCPPRRDSGFLVRGAGTCQLDQSEAAYLVGQVDGSDVSIFILPRHALKWFPRQHRELANGTAHRCREGNYQMVMATIDQSIVLIIGRTGEKQLWDVLDAYGSYHDHA